MNPKLGTIIFLVVIVLLAGGAVIMFFVQDDEEPTSMVNIAIVNVASTTNTDDEVLVANNTNLNSLEFTNTADKTTTTNVSSNTNTITTNATVPVVEALLSPEQFAGSSICLTGFYQSSFEFSGMAANATPDVNGNLQIIGTSGVVWINTTVSSAELTCTTSEFGEESCSGEITTCGVFNYASPGENGFGQVGAYRYKLD